MERRENRQQEVDEDERAQQHQVRREHGEIDDDQQDRGGKHALDDNGDDPETTRDHLAKANGSANLVEHGPFEDRHEQKHDQGQLRRLSLPGIWNGPAKYRDEAQQHEQPEQSGDSQRFTAKPCIVE